MRGARAGSDLADTSANVGLAPRRRSRRSYCRNSPARAFVLSKFGEYGGADKSGRDLVSSRADASIQRLEQMRAEQVAEAACSNFVMEGFHLPRGHLGDFSAPEQRRSEASILVALT